MKPILTVAEMAAVDKAAIETFGIDALIERAGTAQFVRALELLGGTYGRRVAVVAGRGHNGDDGRVAGRLLERRGARVSVLPASEALRAIAGVDMVIDAAYGTGFRGDYDAPKVPEGTVVLAADIPSGLSGDTGVASEGAVRADATVTFGALKPGLVLGKGPSLAGDLRVAAIGLDCSRARMHDLEDSDVRQLLARRAIDAHKWASAVYVVAGSPGMLGAAALASYGALRAGAGMVRLGSPGIDPGTQGVREAVARPLSATAWAGTVLAELPRCRALVVGPGLGTATTTVDELRLLVAQSTVPTVVDADGLQALAPIVPGGIGGAPRAAPIVLTPHEGEFVALFGRPIPDDRIGAVRELAARAGAVVLLKGPTTIVADPGGEVLLSRSGSTRLATAGSGDVLSGVIGAFLARGVSALHAAALGAYVHGRAAALGSEGLVAGDLPALVASSLSVLGPTSEDRR